MHEFSIVMNIVDIAENEAKKHNATSIESIELDIGKISGIEPAALEFAWNSAVANSVLEHAKKKVNYIDGVAQCKECKKKYSIENFYDGCPECSSIFKDIIQGKELRIKSITITN